MNFRDARLLAKNFPDRYRLTAKFLRGDDDKLPVFVWKLEERKEYDLFFTEVYNTGAKGRKADGSVVLSHFRHPCLWIWV